MTSANWDVVDGNPAPGEPESYFQLARALRTTASNAENAHRRLRDIGSQVDESIWRGKAADAFREKIGELPDKLRKLFESYDAASQAMETYGHTLRELQTEAAGYAADAGRAQTDETSAQSALDSAVAADPAAPTTGHQDAVDAARARLRAARERIDDIRDRRRAAEDRAIDGLGHAGDLGIQNRKWYQKALKFIADAAEVVAVVLAVVAIAVVVVVFLTNPGGWAALAAAFAAAGPLFTAATVASGTALAARAGGKLAGDDSVSWERIGLDAALFVGTLGAGKAVGLFKLGGKLGAARTVPQGLTRAQFDDLATTLRAEVGHISDDIGIQGSRAAGTARPGSDIDIGVRVPKERFDDLIKERFGTPNPGSAFERTMQHAEKTGKIQAGEAGLRRLRRSLQATLDMDVDLSIIRRGGPFDNGPWLPIP